MIRNSITHNLTGLLRFSGTDSRAQFWPYAIAVFIGIMVVFMSIFAPRILGAVHRFLRHGDATFPDVSDLRWWTVALMAIQVLLLAAAVTRRLRDRGKSIVWALLPLVPLAILVPIVGDPLSLAGLPAWAFIATFVLNLGYQASLIYLIVLLAGAGPQRAEAGKAG